MMPKIKENDYPTLNIDKAVEATQKFETSLKGSAQNAEALAKILEYKSAKNGAFINAIADLRKYGLMDKRGYNTTELAKKIIIAKGEQKTKYIFEAINNVPLFQNLINKIGKNFENVNFQAILINEGFSELEALTIQPNIRNIYKKIVPYITDGATNIETNKEDDLNQQGDKMSNIGSLEQNMQGATMSQDNLYIANLLSDGISIKIPREQSKIDLVRYLLDRLEKELKAKEKENKE